ncbi:MAG: response regulator [Desulfomonilaceae bacterium]|jgi:two-component system response regulator BaeR
MMGKHVLIVEDESKIADLLRDYLVSAGFTTTTVERGDIAVAEVRKNGALLVLLDIMLPGMDGMDVCREIRKFSNVPIIMITARVEEIDRIIGLELGADDYVCKPFSPREIVARVKSVLRRSQPQPTEPQLRAGPISMDCATREVYVGEHPLILTPNEFALLRALMARPNRVFTRGELLDLVQGYDFDGYDRTIDSHIKNLRKKLAKKIPEQEIISTVYGVGYKLDEVTDFSAEDH